MEFTKFILLLELFLKCKASKKGSLYAEQMSYITVKDFYSVNIEIRLIKTNWIVAFYEKSIDLCNIWFVFECKIDLEKRNAEMIKN